MSFSLRPGLCKLLSDVSGHHCGLAECLCQRFWCLLPSSVLAELALLIVLEDLRVVASVFTEHALGSLVFCNRVNVVSMMEQLRISLALLKIVNELSCESTLLLSSAWIIDRLLSS